MRLAYDGDGRRTAMTDGTGTSTWSYDSLGRATSTTNGAGATIGYTYDARGDLTAIAYPGTTGTVARSYDPAGRIQSITDWKANTTTFTYDADGNLTSGTEPTTTTPVVDSYTYDPADAISGITANQGTTNLDSFSYTRDPNNQIAAVTSTGVPADNHSYGYNPLNQLTTVDTTSYGYSSADNLTQLPDGTTQTFDAADQLTASAAVPPISLIGTASAGDSTSTSLTLALPAGTTTNDLVVVAVTLPYGKNVSAPAGYATVGTYTSATRGSAQVVVFDHAVTAGESSTTISFSNKVAKSVALAVYRDADPGKPIEATSSANTAAATSLTVPGVTATGTGDRLVLVQGAYGTSGTFAAVTGMTTQVQQAGGTTDTALADQIQAEPGATGSRTATYSASTQLVGVLLAIRPNQTSYSYNQRGDRTGVTAVNGTTTSLGYDEADRLTSYGTTTTYTYNGDGLRTSKTVSGVTTQYTWDTIENDVPLLLTDGANNYIYGPDGLPLEQIDSSGNVLWYHHDQLGSTRALTNNSGTVVATFTYGPYGALTASTGTATTPLGYAGGYTDSESGLIYLINRYYDPATAQFLTVDPMVGITRQSYQYADDDPVNESDPLGLCSGWLGCITHYVGEGAEYAAVGATTVAIGATVVATDGADAPLAVEAEGSLLSTLSVTSAEDAATASSIAEGASDVSTGASAVQSAAQCVGMAARTRPLPPTVALTSDPPSSDSELDGTSALLPGSAVQRTFYSPTRSRYSATDSLTDRGDTTKSGNPAPGRRRANSNRPPQASSSCSAAAYRSWMRREDAHSYASRGARSRCGGHLRLANRDCCYLHTYLSQAPA